MQLVRPVKITRLRRVESQGRPSRHVFSQRRWPEAVGTLLRVGVHWEEVTGDACVVTRSTV
jgi:hypothetical protein